MPAKKVEANDIDKYIARFPAQVQQRMTELRAIIKKAAPGAEEIISYKMPAYTYYGILIYFAGYKNHIGFYPRASAIEKFKKELAVYKNAKGSVQFPLNKPLPVKLINKMLAFRVKENESGEKINAKKE